MLLLSKFRKLLREPYLKSVFIQISYKILTNYK